MQNYGINKTERPFVLRISEDEQRGRGFIVKLILRGKTPGGLVFNKYSLTLRQALLVAETMNETYNTLHRTDWPLEINVERDALEKQHDADAETFRLWQKIRAEGRLTITEEHLKID